MLEKGIDVAGEYWGLLYLIPNFHNPTGRSLSPSLCQRVIEAAKAHGLLVLCDDVYNLLGYDQALTFPRLVCYDPICPQILSNGSFSKILAPGVRVGWIEAAPDTIKGLSSSGILNSGGAANHLMSGGSL